MRGVWDGEAESRLVAEEIERAHRGERDEAPLVYRDMAILVRASFQMRAFEERFVLMSIPYTVVGGPRFFERAEIRDAHAYLRLVQSPDDDLAFERIINTPRRGIGEASVQKLFQIARASGVSALTAAREAAVTDELPARTRTSLANFLRDLDRWTALARDTHHARVTEAILEESGYTDALRADRTPTAQTRLENLKELVQSMDAFDTLQAYLEHVSLVMDMDRGPQADAVQIMTLHSAKGLEFPLVFLPGWEEGVFPSQRSLDETGEKGLEEERRLAYVGLTRARKSARISFAANRLVYGLDQPAAQPLRRRTARGPRRGRLRDRLFQRRAGHAGGVEPLGRDPGLRLRLRLPRLAAGPGPAPAGRPREPQGGHRGRGAAPRRLRSPVQRLCPGRPGLPPEVRLWPGPRRRGLEADRGLRQGRREEGARQLRREGLTPRRACGPAAGAPSCPEPHGRRTWRD